MVVMMTALCSAPLQGQEVKTGKVSFYGGKHHGRKTASGEVFDKHGLTAASPLKPGTNKPVYPFGTELKVTNVSNGRSVIVRINDTGAFGKYNRKLDLSEGAFEEIASKDKGVIKTTIERL